MKEPWKPQEPFDWRTGGRALSEKEREVLRRLLMQDGRGEKVRRPVVWPRGLVHEKK